MGVFCSFGGMNSEAQSLPGSQELWAGGVCNPFLDVSADRVAKALRVRGWRDSSKSQKLQRAAGETRSTRRLYIHTETTTLRQEWHPNASVWLGSSDTPPSRPCFSYHTLHQIRLPAEAQRSLPLIKYTLRVLWRQLEGPSEVLPLPHTVYLGQV